MDIILQETYNGGDVLKKGNDLAAVFGYENTIYQALFGGNPGHITPTTRVPKEQAFDWWGNKLFFPDNPSAWLNSLTENALNTIELTSSGRVLIENAVKADLEFLSTVAKVEVNTTIVATDRVDTIIKVIWNDKTANTIIINFRKPPDGDFWLMDFNDDFNV